MWLKLVYMESKFFSTLNFLFMSDIVKIEKKCDQLTILLIVIQKPRAKKKHEMDLFLV